MWSTVISSIITGFCCSSFNLSWLHLNYSQINDLAAIYRPELTTQNRMLPKKKKSRRASPTVATCITLTKSRLLDTTLRPELPGWSDPAQTTWVVKQCRLLHRSPLTLRWRRLSIPWAWPYTRDALRQPQPSSSLSMASPCCRHHCFPPLK